MKSKRCHRCNKRKRLSLFHNNSGAPDGKVDECKPCANARVRAWNKQNPEKVKASQRAARQRRLGISDPSYVAMYSAREGRCDVCNGQFPFLCRDHDHLTGEDRGMLCTKCNLTLGFLETVVPGFELTRLDRYVEYLGRHNRYVEYLGRYK